MVWSAPLSEKKLVSPEKNAPFTGSCSSLAAGSGEDWNDDGALAGCCSHAEPVTGALHQASPVAPAAEPISAVSAGRGEFCSPLSGQIGWLVAPSSGSVGGAT